MGVRNICVWAGKVGYLRAAVVACVLAMLLPGCGRDPVVDGQLGDACFSSDDCVFGLDCLDGRCISDSITDPNPDPNPDNECSPGERICLSGDEIGVCRGDQGFVVEEVCVDGSICEGARCVPSGVCDEGERRCNGRFEVEVCEFGRWDFEQNCTPDRPCRDGQCLADRDLPDIVADGVDFGPSQLQTGQRISADLAVFNGGGERVMRFECVFNISRGEIDPRSDVTIGRINLPGLDPGEFEGVGFSGPLPRNVSQGRYRLYAFCDPNDDIEEINESNNLIISDQILTVGEGDGLPDLVIEEAFVEGDFVEEGEEVFVFAFICNQGEGPAEGAVLRLDAVSARDESRVLYQLEEFEVDFLEPGECFDFFVPGRARCVEGEEEFIVRAIVDPNNRIRELNERNNTTFADPPVFVEGCEQQECGDRFDPENPNNPPVLAPGSYELQLCEDDRDVFALRTGLGDTVELFFETFPLNVFIVTAFVQIGDRRETLEVFQVEGGFFETRLTLPEASNRLILSIEPRIVVEPDYFFSFEITDDPRDLPDLIVLEANMFPPPFEAGSLKRLTFLSANESDVDAGAHNYNIFVDSLRQRVGRLSLPEGLEAGEARDHVTTVTLPDNLGDGEHELIIQADSDNNIEEISEANNTFIFEFFVGDDVVCVDDDFEPNNSFNDPADIEAGEFDALRLCTGNTGRDFYRVCPPEGSNLDITLRFDHEGGDVDTRLYDSRREVVDSSNGVNDNEEVGVDDTDGCYILEVFLFADRPVSGTTYSMEVNVEPPDNPDECTEAFEPNNNFDQSSPLFDAERAPVLDFCPRGDTDFYSVILAEGNTVTITVAPLGEQPPGDIVLAFFGPNMNFITQRFEREPTLTQEIDATGTYFIRLVTSSGAELFQYSLEAEVD